MKRLLAILALVSVVLVVPMTALATDDPEMEGQNQADGLYAPPGCEHQDEPVQQDNQGDPDELGGGFRGSGNPPGSTGAGGSGFWLDPFFIMVMNLV